MAKAKKPGIDYFPVDVNLMSDTRIKVLFSKYHAEGCWFYMYIMSEILREGYYVELSEDFLCCAAADMRLEYEQVMELIQFMCRKGLFDEKLCSRGVLTSREIQETYQEVKCAHGRGAAVRREYWLLEGKQPANLFFEEDGMQEKSSCNAPAMEAETTPLQEKNALKKRKEKESKENETKANESKANETKADESKPDESKPDHSAPGKTEFAAVTETFNAVCRELPKVRGMTPNRRRAIVEALGELGSEGLTGLFRKVSQSDFLCGRKGSWKATFDWILTPEHITRILEGNYDNNSAPPDDYTCGGKYKNALEQSPGDEFLF